MKGSPAQQALRRAAAGFNLTGSAGQRAAVPFNLTGLGHSSLGIGLPAFQACQLPLTPGFVLSPAHSPAML